MCTARRVVLLCGSDEMKEKEKQVLVLMDISVAYAVIGRSCFTR